MASLRLEGSTDLVELGIYAEDDVTGVGFKIGLGTLGKVIQCLGLPLFKVYGHLFRTGAEVLLFNE